MQIIIHTENGKALVESIDAKMDNGDLRTWEIKLNEKNEVFYNHNRPQWSGEVLLQPLISSDGFVKVVTFWPNNWKPDEATKGYIIGRFIEILMVHFRDHFSKLEVS